MEVVYGPGEPMFSNEELRGLSNIENGPNYIEVRCVLKSHDLGELPGNLKIFREGKLEIKCDCYSDCPKDKLSPRSFLKHYKRRQISNWKSQICIIDEKDKRIPLRNTPLLKYHYKETPEEVEGTLRPRPAIHRDEFILCSQCGKERRFRLRTATECRAYHDALAKVFWTCSDFPYETKTGEDAKDKKITCEDAEERKSRKACRGCPVSARCDGCMSCVCVGCGMCRFKNCLCRTCIDFIRNIGE